MSSFVQGVEPPTPRSMPSCCRGSKWQAPAPRDCSPWPSWKIECQAAAAATWIAFAGAAFVAAEVASEASAVAEHSSPQNRSAEKCSLVAVAVRTAVAKENFEGSFAHYCCCCWVQFPTFWLSLLQLFERCKSTAAFKYVSEPRSA